MYVSVGLIKELGFQKIMAKFMRGDEFEQALNRVYECSSTFKVPPFSLMSYWGILRDSDSPRIQGIKSWGIALDPKIIVDLPERPLKDKFRNSYESNMTSFLVSIGANPILASKINELGTKLPFMALLSEGCDMEELYEITKGLQIPEGLEDSIYFLCDFYNALFLWIVSMLYPTRVRGHIPAILRGLVVHSPDSFVDFVNSEWSSWV